MNDLPLDRGLADASEQVLEELTVLRHLDRFQRGSEEPHAVTIQDAQLSDLHGEVQAGLATDRRQDPVRALPLDDPADHIRCQRLDIDRIGDVLVGHDRCRVGVDKDRPDPLLPQRLASLCAGVVKLGGLADHDRAGPDHENAFRLLKWRGRCCRHARPILRSSAGAPR